MHSFIGHNFLNAKTHLNSDKTYEKPCRKEKYFDIIIVNKHKGERICHLLQVKECY